MGAERTGHDEVLAVTIVGTLDAAAAEALRHELTAQLTPTRAHLALDFQSSVALSVVGLGAIMALAARAEELGGSVTLRALMPADAEALKVIGMERLVAAAGHAAGSNCA